MESADRVQLKEATLCTPEQAEPGTLTFSAETLRTEDGTLYSLEDYEGLEGTCHAMETRKEALGSGDAWIALGIGTLCGWAGCCFALVAGSILGLLWALVARIGRGQPMPFGPVLIMGAWVYLFYGRELVEELLYRV